MFLGTREIFFLIFKNLNITGPDEFFDVKCHNEVNVPETFYAIFWRDKFVIMRGYPDQVSEKNVSCKYCTYLLHYRKMIL